MTYQKLNKLEVVDSLLCLAFAVTSHFVGLANSFAEAEG